MKFAAKLGADVGISSWGYTFLTKNPGIFRFATSPLEIPEKTNFHPRNLCDTPWKFQGQKPRPKEIPHDFL